MASLSETLALYILQPFRQLLQDNQEFKWSPRCEEAFKKTKDSLSSSNVLVHYDPSLPVILESDASQYGSVSSQCKENARHVGSTSAAHALAREAGTI